MGAPDRPEKPAIVHRGHKHLKLTWTPPADGGSTIVEYELDMRKCGAEAVGHRPEPCYKGLALTHSVLHLEPSAKYEFSLLARNADGSSKHSTQLVCATLEGETPAITEKPTALRHLSADGSTPPYVEVGWGHVDDRGYEVDQIEIAHTPAGEDTWLSLPPLAASTATTHTTLPDDVSTQVSHVRVRAHNKLGWSEWSPAASVKHVTHRSVHHNTHRIYHAHDGHVMSGPKQPSQQAPAAADKSARGDPHASKEELARLCDAHSNAHRKHGSLRALLTAYPTTISALAVVAIAAVVRALEGV
jgi:hypothetical protein